MRLLLAIVLALAAAWAGYWFIGSTALETGIRTWFDQRRAQGWVASYDDMGVSGFPNQFVTSFTDLRLGDPASGVTWEAPFFQISTLSYTPNHFIAVWPHDQRLETPDGAFAVASSDMRASLVIEASTAVGLKRATLTATDLAVTPAQIGGAPLSATSLHLAAERDEGAGDPRYHLGLAAQDVAPPAPLVALLRTGDIVPRVIDSVVADLTVTFDAPWDRFAVQDTRPQPTRVEIRRIDATWGAMMLEASGDLDIDAMGTPMGTITVTAHHWREMLDLAQGAGLLTPDMAGNIERALAALESDGKVLELPLTLKTGQIWLGPLPIAEAPVLRLR